MSYVPTLRGSCPWGQIDDVVRFERDGVLLAVSVSTPSHGGIWVAADQMAKIPADLRATTYSPGQWFEEDCDWAVPYHYLNLGPLDPYKDQSDAAKRTLAQWLKVDVPA